MELFSGARNIYSLIVKAMKLSGKPYLEAWVETWLLVFVPCSRCICRQYLQLDR